MFSRECLLERSVDVTVRGQGEETFAEIVERLAHGRPLDDCAGMHGTARDGSIRENPARTLAQVDKFRAHDYGLIPGRALFRTQGQAAARLHFIARVQFPLRVLLGPVRLWTQVGRTRARAHGNAVEGVMGPVPFR